MRPRLIVAIVLLNAALAAAMQALAPGQPIRTDRREYEYTGRHPLERNCPNSIYCYRLIVPVLLHAIPGESESKWRAHQLAANSAAGATLAVATYHVMPIASWAVLASIIVQTSYGFTFTAYDPYTADPLVFLISSLLLLCWVRNRAVAALVIAAIGVFAKETVALVAVSMAIAALFDRHRPGRWVWVLQGVVATGLLLGFHVVMDTFFGWNTLKSTAAGFSSGSWLAIWWKSNPFLSRKLLMLFAPFGFAWIWALLGWRFAAREIRFLAFGSIVPMLALVYVQTPERALGNAFFVVVPLAVAFVSRAPMIVALVAVIANGLVTARMGLSSTLLPSTAVLLVPAALAAAWAFRRNSRVSEAEAEAPNGLM